MVTKVEHMEVVKEGKKFIMPEGLSYDKAIELLQRQKTFEEEVTVIREDIDCFIWDGAIAMNKAMQEMFGWATAEPTPGFFGDTPPTMLSVEVEYGKTVLVTWGRFSLPGIKGAVWCGAAKKNGRAIFNLSAEVKRKDEKIIKELIELTRKIATENSIYKGKAFKMRFSDDEGDPLPLPLPSFLDLSHVKEGEILFSEDVQKAVSTNLYTPIERSAECREHQIPLKRGVLLSGPYGTGKTLAAYGTAAKCVRNNWTFLYCEHADELEDMVRFAHQYQPAVVFCEDIDRVVSGDRSVEMDDILNIVDGIESKKTEIMVILTTNHIEHINKAMLRPGRLDAVINVLPPDAKTVEKLLHMYGRGLINPSEDLSQVGERLAGKIPAVIRECIERAKLSAIKLSKPGDKLVITSAALLDAAVGMDMQLKLLASDSHHVSDSKKAGKLVGKVFTKLIEESQNGEIVETDLMSTLIKN